MIAEAVDNEPFILVEVGRIPEGNMKKISKVGLLICILLCNVMLSAEIKVVVLAIEYPPFTMNSEDNGLSFKLIREALGEKYKIIPEFLPPARADALFKNNERMITLMDSDYSKVRGAVRITDYNVRLVFFYNKESAIQEWRILSDLKGKTLAKTRSFKSRTGQLIKPLVDAGINIVEVDSIASAFRMLHEKRIDLVFSVDVTGEYIVRTLFGNDKIVMMRKEYMLLPGGPWFNTSLPGSDAIVRDYKIGMRRIIKNGRARKIFEEYYGKGKVPDSVFIYEQ